MRRCSGRSRGQGPGGTFGRAPRFLAWRGAWRIFGVPILILVIVAILVAQIGFWDTFAAVLGAIGVVFLVVVTAVALLFLTGFWLFRRARRLS